MIAALILAIVVTLAVAYLATGSRSGSGQTLSETEAADRLRPHSGSVEAAPQRPPVD